MCTDFREDDLYKYPVEAACFDDLDADIKDDLEAWYNADITTEEQKARLFLLISEGRFKAWNCPCDCEATDPRRVFKADVKAEEWPHFQGTQNQDFASYPGDPDKYQRDYIQALCDGCRAHG